MTSPQLNRVMLLADAGERAFAVEIDGRDAHLEVALNYERDEPEIPFLERPWRYNMSLGRLRVEIEATHRHVAEHFYVIRELRQWPDLTGEHRRCAAELVPALGVSARCERWAGHEFHPQVSDHVAGGRAWRDGSRRMLARTPHIP